MITAICKILWISLNILVGFVCGLVLGTAQVIAALLGGGSSE